MTSGRVVWTVDPIAVALPGLDPRDVRVPDVAVDLDELDAGLRAVVFDQAEFDFGRYFGKECEVHPGAVERRTQRVWPSRPHVQALSLQPAYLFQHDALSCPGGTPRAPRQQRYEHHPYPPQRGLSGHLDRNNEIHATRAVSAPP